MAKYLHHGFDLIAICIWKEFYRNSRSLNPNTGCFWNARLNIQFCKLNGRLLFRQQIFHRLSNNPTPIFKGMNTDSMNPTPLTLR